MLVGKCYNRVATSHGEFSRLERKHQRESSSFPSLQLSARYLTTESRLAEAASGQANHRHKAKAPCTDETAGLSKKHISRRSVCATKLWSLSQKGGLYSSAVFPTTRTKPDQPWRKMIWISMHAEKQLI